MMYGYGHMWFMPWGWMIGVVVFGLVIWLIVRLANQPAPPHQAYHNQNRALDILKERYAKGEISKEEFEEKKKDIS